MPIAIENASGGTKAEAISVLSQWTLGFRSGLEPHDVSQRYSNIFFDCTRAGKDMGVAAVGSIHRKTGRVCLQVRHLPEELTPLQVGASGVFCR